MLAGMPALAPGYIASQKILHTLQCLNYEGPQWAEQVMRDNLGALPYMEFTDEEKRIVKNYLKENGIK